MTVYNFGSNVTIDGFDRSQGDLLDSDRIEDGVWIRDYPIRYDGPYYFEEGAYAVFMGELDPSFGFIDGEAYDITIPRDETLKGDVEIWYVNKYGQTYIIMDVNSDGIYTEGEDWVTTLDVDIELTEADFAPGVFSYIFGTSGNDILEGTEGDDRFVALGGDDGILTYGGNDYVDIVSGNNSVDTGAGDDFITSNLGDESDPFYTNNIYAGDGNDTIELRGTGSYAYGGSGNDVINLLGGGSYQSQFVGTDNFLFGGGGDDVINFGGSGASADGVAAYGGSGNDTISGASRGSYYIQGGTGNDQISGFASTYIGPAEVALSGGEGDDYITGGSASDSSLTMSGGEGNDILWGRTSTINGGPGYDLIFFGTSVYSEGSIVRGGADGDRFVIGEYSTIEGYTLITDFDYAEGDRIELNDVVDGVTTGDWQLGGRYLPVAFGGQLNSFSFGNFEPFPGDPQDDLVRYFYYQEGGDTYLIVDADADLTFDRDTDIVVRFNGTIDFTADYLVDVTTRPTRYLYGTEADDTLTGFLDSYEIYGYGGDDLITGVEGDDLIDAGDGSDTVFGSDGDDTIYGQLGFDTIDGGYGNDILDGGSGVDIIYGGFGNDTIYGAGGGDRLYGDSGDDEIYAGSGGDFVYGGDGADYIFADNGDDEAYGGNGADVILGEYGWDSLYGEQGEDDIRGGGGNDSLYGGDDNDIIRGGDGDDIVAGGRQDDQVFGGTGNDYISGDNGFDFLRGGDGDDTITGGYGEDNIGGERGTDRLEGGRGADTFLFANASHLDASRALTDFIVDFTQADGDLIDLQGIDANTNANGNQAFSFVGMAAFSGTAGELRYLHVNGQTVVQMDTDGDGNHDLSLMLDGVIDLTANDFIL